MEPSGSSTSISIVPISLADVRQLSRVVAFASTRDPVQVFLYNLPRHGEPGLERAIESTIGSHRAWLNRILCNPSIHIASAKSGDRIAGFSIWVSPDNDPSARRYIPYHLRIFGLLNGLYNKLLSFFYTSFLQRAQDPAVVEQQRKRGVLRQTDEAALKLAIPADVRSRGYWTMAGVGVLQEYARQGLGSKLMQWGCKEADKTDRAIVVAASPDGEKLYRSCGFELIRKETVFEDEVEGGITLAYMIRFPASQRKKQ